MLVLIHVLVAVSSILYTSYVWLTPAKSRFYISYLLIGLTLISGSWLVWSHSAALLPACSSGLLYLAAVSAALLSARHRWNRQQVNRNTDYVA